MKSGTGTASIATGGTLGFVADQGITHPGPVQFYMAKAPEGKDINTWEAAGNVWFKVASIDADSTPGAKALSWPTYRKSWQHIMSSKYRSSPDMNIAVKKNATFTVPKSLPGGNYLVRVESIALHQAQSPGGAQFYLACAQVMVTDGGNGNPSPYVSIPGLYKSNDPGLLFANYPVPTSYTPPGPPVWDSGA